MVTGPDFHHRRRSAGCPGIEWPGVSEPQEPWDIATPPTVNGNVPYHTIMEQYYTPENHKWDEAAQADYLSIDENGEKTFVSFDGPKTIEAKCNYMVEKGLGGAIIWELTGGYFDGVSAAANGERDPLLQAVNQHVH